MSEPSVPMLVSDLSAGWLTGALREAGHLDPSAEVTSLRAEPFGEGVGMVGQLARLHVTYSAGVGLPATFIVKLPSPYEANRAQMQQFRYYVREALFYREVAPMAGIRTPRCWWSAIDHENALSAILLEDVAHLSSPDQIAGMSPELAERAVRAIARFHARWWQSPELDSIDWMDYGNGPITMGAVPLFQFAWPMFLDNGFRALLTDAQVALGEKVRDRFGSLLTDFGGEPRTICHTDFRSENMFFGEPGTDDEFVLIDWQLTTRSGGMYDVSYLLAQSLTVEDRRAHEDRLLRAYHEELSAGGVDVSFDEVRDFYRIGLMVCLVIPVSVGGMLDMANERGRLLAETITERTFTAAIDLDCGSLLDEKYPV